MYGSFSSSRSAASQSWPLFLFRPPMKSTTSAKEAVTKASLISDLGFWFESSDVYPFEKIIEAFLKRFCKPSRGDIS